MGLFTKSPDQLFKEAMKAYEKKEFSKALPTMEKVAGQGHMEAQFVCGVMYYMGQGTAVNKEQARKWLRKAADQGHATAMQNYAVILEEVDKNYPEALAWAEKAKAAGARQAEALMADIQKRMDAKKAAAEKAAAEKAAAEKAAAEKAAAAQAARELSPEERYEKGMELFRAGKYEEAFPLLNRACPILGLRKNKYPEGHVAVAWMIENGKGTEQKESMAYTHYRIAARNGDRAGMAGVVRLLPTRETPSGEECTLALTYAETLGDTTSIPAIRQKLEEAQAREAAEEEQKRREQESSRLFDEAVSAGEAGDHEKELNLFEQAAQLGSVTAMYNCGVMYTKGEGIAVDTAKALHWFQKAADQGHEKAQLICKEMEEAQAREKRDRLFEEAIAAGEAGDKEKQLALFEQAAQLESVSAMYNCGVMYAKGEGTAPDIAKALYWFQKAADQGHTKAQFFCQKLKEVQDLVAAEEERKSREQESSRLFEEAVAAGEAGDHEKQLNLFEQAARLGELTAMFNCGVMYSKGEGTAIDKAKALYWYEKAAEQGDASAQFNCGIMYYNGDGTAMDHAKGLYWFEEAAKQGNMHAQYVCGMYYDQDESAKVNKVYALDWYEKAAEQGNADAQFRCSRMYSKGEGTDINKERAHYWCEQAAEQGMVEAQFNCAMYYSENGSSDGYKALALHWFEKAAEQGIPEAQLNCGICYCTGRGVPVDKTASKEWLSKAANQDENKKVADQAKRILEAYF